MSDADVTDFNRTIIEEFRANGGKVGGYFANVPLLLLHHRGATSGKTYIAPLAYQRDGDRYVIFASMAGAPVDPQWYRNLLANPDVEIEVGEERLPVRAVELVGEERDRIYLAQATEVPTFAEYVAKAAPRVIPVVALAPRS